MINLDNRLLAVFDAILPCEIVVDIGTDHGKIPVKAVLEGRCLKAIASDISAPSLKKAGQFAVKNGVENLVSCRLGDGLQSIELDEYDTLVIAGMGGLEIVEILSKAKKKFNNYILLPHRNSEELRKFLSKQNIKPYNDYILECKDKFYSLIVARVGEYLPSELDLRYGLTRSGKVFKKFLCKEIARIEKVFAFSGEVNNLVEYYKEIINLYESI